MLPRKTSARRDPDARRTDARHAIPAGDRRRSHGRIGRHPGLQAEAAGDELGVAVGMIYNGGSSASDAQWLAVAGRRIHAYEAQAGATPNHVLFQSWMDKPDRAIPEADAAPSPG